MDAGRLSVEESRRDRSLVTEALLTLLAALAPQTSQRSGAALLVGKGHMQTALEQSSARLAASERTVSEGEPSRWTRVSHALPVSTILTTTPVANASIAQQGK